MLYDFRCSDCNLTFEVNQPITVEHKADCPECGKPAQRKYSMPSWIWAGSVFRPDGSLREADDYARLKG